MTPIHSVQINQKNATLGPMGAGKSRHAWTTKCESCMPGYTEGLTLQIRSGKTAHPSKNHLFSYNCILVHSVHSVGPSIHMGSLPGFGLVILKLPTFCLATDQRLPQFPLTLISAELESGVPNFVTFFLKAESSGRRPVPTFLEYKSTVTQP